MKKIRFIPSDQAINHNLQPPQPSKLYMPQWYKDSEMFVSKNTGLVTDKKDPDFTGGLKSCLPFLDAMISGYMVTTWHDIKVVSDDYGISFEYVRFNEKINNYEKLAPSAVCNIIEERTGDIGSKIPRPSGHRQNHFIWKGQWGIRLPRGWSLMVTHPYNRYDLPFTTMSGFMDSDNFWTNGNLPFFIKEDFNGIIPQGTPVAQLIPIKRQSWMAYSSIFSKKYSDYLGHKARSVKYGYYRDKNWTKKVYQ